MEDYKIRRMRRHGNEIRKEKVEPGIWKYTVLDRDGVVLAEMLFRDADAPGKRLSTADLLEIARDRLKAICRIARGNAWNRNALDRVTEAILWSEVPASLAKAEAELTDDWPEDPAVDTYGHKEE